MAAPCRKFSNQIFRVFSFNNRNSSSFGPSLRCRRLKSSIHTSIWQLNHPRQLSTSCQTFNTPSSNNKPYGEGKKPGIISRIAMKSHHSTIRLLNRISPRARVFYERFVDGATSFVQDFRFVYSLNKRLKKEEVTLKDLEWKDIYKKIQMKQDVAKVLPVLVIVNIPFVYYVTLPIVLYFQRIFLSDHFITPEDVANNHQENHKKRLLLYPPILQRLNGRLMKKPTSDLAESLHQRIGGDQLEKQPFSAAELLSFKPVFSKQTSLNSLSRTHLKYLCKLHSQWVLLAGKSTLRKRLSSHATLITAMDQALLRAGLHSIDEQDFRKLCYQRGLNPVESDKQVLIKWLTEWTKISTTLTDAERSLLLHASVLLVTGRPHQGEGQKVKEEVKTTPKKDESQV